MIKVVIDTNVVVSANLTSDSPAATILDLAANRKILMFVSPAMLAEYEEVLCRPRFKLDPGRVANVLMVIRSTSTEVFPARILKISGHESDNRFYECAEAASADFLITGNTKDFSRDYKTTRIITPRAFLDLIIARLDFTAT